MKKLKTQKGITLMALVITIIVMLILVTVTITIAVNGGLFNYAGIASGKTKNAIDEEQALANGRIKIAGKWYASIDDYLAGKVMTGGVDAEWDKDATSEDFFVWASDSMDDGELYGTIIGYKDKILNETEIKIPSRCVSINLNYKNLRTANFKEGPTKDYYISGTGDVSWNQYYREQNNIKSIEIPNTVTKINESFAYFEKLESVNIPESITYIGGNTFYNCGNLNEINFPSNIQYIGEGAFDTTGWYNIQPDGPIYIGKVLYSYKGYMPENTEFEVKDGTISISRRAFYSSSWGDSNSTQTKFENLVKIIFPESLCFIDHNAFYGCYNLETIEGKNGYDLSNITFVGGNNFNGFASKTYPSSFSKWYENQPAGAIYIGKVLYSYKGTIGSTDVITIKDGTIHITDSAFERQYSLTQVEIPDSVEVIGNRAFSSCNLKTLNLPKNIMHIGGSTFAYNSNLTNVNFPEEAFGHRCANDIVDTDVRAGTIGQGAFYGCKSLKTVYILGQYPYVADNAFTINVIH